MSSKIYRGLKFAVGKWNNYWDHFEYLIYLLIYLFIYLFIHSFIYLFIYLRVTYTDFYEPTNVNNNTKN